ncbi:MAG: hypothetical protein ACEY3F_07715, partial [Wolbachia sp.]
KIGGLLFVSILSGNQILRASVSSSMAKLFSLSYLYNLLISLLRVLQLIAQRFAIKVVVFP